MGGGPSGNWLLFTENHNSKAKAKHYILVCLSLAVGIASGQHRLIFSEEAACEHVAGGEGRQQWW